MYKLRNFINYPALPMVDQQIWWGILDLVLKGIVFSGATVGIYSLMFRRDQPYKELGPVIFYVWTSLIGRRKIGNKSPVTAK
jgi:hypothetical protein